LIDKEAWLKIAEHWLQMAKETEANLPKGESE